MDKLKEGRTLHESILLVEDDPLVGEFTRELLGKFGYSVAGFVSTADDAVNMAQTSRPDLVLMDIGLEGKVDGIDAARRIRFNTGIPVVFMTGKEDNVTLERAKEAEPIGYILKPFQPGELRTTIETSINYFRVSQRRIDEAIRNSELEYQQLFNDAREGIFRTTASGQLLSANPALCRMLGYDSLDEIRSLVRFVPQHMYVDSQRSERLKQLLQENGFVHDFEVEFHRKDGSVLLAQLQARVVLDGGSGQLCYEGIVQDITEQKKARKERELMEIQLRQAQKLEAVGQLAAGIAHEINTPTQYIGDNARFLQGAIEDFERVLSVYDRLMELNRKGATDPQLVAEVDATIRECDLDYLREEMPKAISQAMEGIQRVAAIVRAMKEFSHPSVDEKQPVDLNHAIQNTITVARNEWKYVADMSTEFDPNLPSVPCLPGEINQVILNLIINAVHAITDVVGDGSNGKGKITISTETNGNWAEVRVRDTGTGIPEPVRPKIFEPFFTTKDVGKGTGQGLAIARAVVVGKHGGTIDFQTEVGKGTTFVVRLPLDSTSDGDTRDAEAITVR